MSIKNKQNFVIEVFFPDDHTWLSYSFDKDVVTVGRAYSNDIVVKDDFVSLEHLRIRTDSNGFSIKDLSSTNGTVVHKERVKNKETILKSGQECRLGRTRLRIYAADHKLSEPLTLNWGTKLQPLLKNMFVALMLFITVLVSGVSYGWLVSDPYNYMDEDIYLYLLITGAVFAVTMTVCTTNLSNRDKKIFSSLQASLASIVIMVVCPIVLFVTPYFYFYVPDMFIKNILDCVLIVTGTILVGMFLSYVNEGRLRWKVIAQFFILGGVIAFFPTHPPADYDPTPRFSSTLVAADMPLPKVQTIDEFLTAAQSVFGKNK